MQFKSIQTGLTVKAGTCLVLTSGLLFVFVSSMTKTPTSDSSRNLAVARASNEAQKASFEIERAARVSRTISGMLDTIKPTNGRSRSTLTGIMKQVLSDNNSLSAVHSFWEAKVLEAPGSGNAGKPGEPVNLGWHRAEKGDLLQNSPAGGQPEWYQKVRAEKKPMVWGPAPSAGKGLFVSAISPVVLDGNFEGVVVAEISLEGFQLMADAAGAFEVPGQIMIVNSAGNVAAFTSRPEMAGKPAGNVIPGMTREAILNGPADAQLVNGSMNVVIPFTPASAEKPWALCLSLPANAQSAPSSSGMGRNLIFFTGLMALAIAALWVIAGTFARPLRKVARFAEVASKGEIKSGITVGSYDDIARIGMAINGFIDSGVGDSWRGGIATGPVQNLAQLLEVAGRPADAEIPAVADQVEAGNGADSFQQVINEISKIVSLAQDVAESVATTAANAQGMNQDLVSEIEEKTGALSGTSESLERMSGLIQEMSDNALLSSTVVQRTMKTSQQGVQAIQNSVRTLARMEKRSQLTAEKLQKLREGTQEISEMLQGLSGVSKRISYLSLNTAIQAAEAGPAGHGFTVLAEEIERMARQSSEATRQIGSLVAGIQSSTEEVITATDETCQDAQDGTQVAEHVVHVLDELQSVSQELSDLTMSISKAASAQSENSAAVTETVTELLSLNGRTAEQIRKSTASVIGLGTKAAELRETVASIVIPKSDD